MDFKQLATLREVVLTGSVSEAARRLGRTQPAVSHLLAKLEKELGMPLFERRNGRLHPMPETDFLFGQASRILSDLENTRVTMQRFRDVQAGTLRIVSMPGPAVEFLPYLIAKHLADRPDVKITLVSRSSEAVYQLLETQQFDIGLADHRPDITGNDFGPSAHRRTFHFERVCAIAASHPLARRQSVSLADLSGEPLATLFPEHSTTRDLKQQFDAKGYEFSPRFEGQFFLHLLQYVLGGHACALIDPIAMDSWKRTQKNSGAVRFLPVVPKFFFTVDLITPKAQTRSQISRFFEACMVEALTALSGKTDTQFTP